MVDARQVTVRTECVETGVEVAAEYGEPTLLFARASLSSSSVIRARIASSSNAAWLLPSVRGFVKQEPAWRESLGGPLIGIVDPVVSCRGWINVGRCVHNLGSVNIWVS